MAKNTKAKDEQNEWPKVEGIWFVTDPERGYRCKWVDPDTGKWKWKTMRKLGKTSKTAVVTWARRKSRQVLARKAKLEAGGLRYEPKSLADAVEGFFEAKEAELRDQTVKFYRRGTKCLLEWADQAGIREPGDLTARDLARFRTWLTKRRRFAPEKGRERGAWTATGKKLHPTTVNNRLRTVRIVLNAWRRIGLTPKLDGDAVRDSLPSVRAARSVPKFLRGPEVERVLRACLRHDADLYDMTREDRAAGRKPGESETPRFEPMAAFTATLVLTGMRVGECRLLRWDQVDLPHGEIVLDTGTKTKTGRRIPLDVTPTLADLLGRMKLQAGDALFVFGKKGYGETLLKRTLSRLRAKFGAPRFTWQDLRRTCGTYLACSGGIYGSASAYMAARRLGHSIAVAEKHYLGAITDIPTDAKALEAALGVEGVMGQVVGASEPATTRASSAGD